MKKYIFILFSFVLALSVQAFSLSNLAKSVSEVAGSATQSDLEKSLVAKQESALFKYKESRVNFLKGFSIIAEELGATDLKQTADNALAKVETQSEKDFDVEAVANTTTQVANAVKEEGWRKSLLDKVATSESTKKYNDGISYFKKAIDGEMETAKIVADLSKETFDAMESSSAAEKIKIASSLKPTLDLAKIISEDISNSKDSVKSMISLLKNKGVNLSSNVLSLFCN